ncbi:hypothetical protein [Parvibaculum sp. MBR-TMA-1.3b-4.2]|jgi:hypothetical protein
MSTAQEIANQAASRMGSVGHDIAVKAQQALDSGKRIARDKAGIKVDQAVIAAGYAILSLYAIAIVVQVLSNF